MGMNGYTKYVIGVLVSVLLGTAGWAGKRQIDRLDRVETVQADENARAAASREALTSLKDDMTDLRQDVRDIKRLLMEQRRH